MQESKQLFSLAERPSLPRHVQAGDMGVLGSLILSWSSWPRVRLGRRCQSRPNWHLFRNPGAVFPSSHFCRQSSLGVGGAQSWLFLALLRGEVPPRFSSSSSHLGLPASAFELRGVEPGSRSSYRAKQKPLAPDFSITETGVLSKAPPSFIEESFPNERAALPTIFLPPS